MATKTPKYDAKGNIIGYTYSEDLSPKKTSTGFASGNTTKTTSTNTSTVAKSLPTDEQKQSALEAYNKGFLTESQYNQYSTSGATPLKNGETTASVDQEYLKSITNAEYFSRDPEQKTSFETALNLTSSKLSESNAKMAEMTSQMSDVTNQLNNSRKQYETSFNEISQMLGAQKNLFMKDLSRVEKETGSKVDLENPELKKALEEDAKTGGENRESILRKYVDKTSAEEVQAAKDAAIKAGMPAKDAENVDQVANTTFLNNTQAKSFYEDYLKKNPATTAEEETTSEQDRNNISYETDKVPDQSKAFHMDIEPEVTKPTTEIIGEGLSNISNMDSSSLMSTLSGYGLDLKNMTSGEALQVMLLQQGINMADDPTTQNFLLKAADTAKSTYESAISTYGNSIDEIDKAMSGEDFIPSSYEGLAAKAYTDMKNMQLENVEAEKEYMSKQFNVSMSEDREKRGRLEGYLKAKLYASGALDSSAGLSAMALTVNAADRNIELKQANYNYSMSQLNNNAKSIMSDFTNKVVQLGMDAETKLSTAQSTYSDKITEIEGNMIADDKEKQKMKLSALSTFTDKMQTLDAQKKEQQRWEYEQSYKKIRDAVDDSYKLSGMMGTYYGVDANGQLFDSGVKTFETQKWEQSNYLEQQKYQHTLETDAFNKSMKLLDTYGSAASGAVEQSLGMPAGSLSSLKTIEEQKNATSSFFNSMFLTSNTQGQSLGESPISNGFKNGTKGGQCGLWARTTFFDLPPMGDTLESKVKTMNNVLGVKGMTQTPQVGDMLIVDVGTSAGHVEVVSETYADGSYKVKESNWNGDEKIGERTIKPNGQKVVAIHRGDLKPEWEQMLGTWQSNQTNDTTKLLQNGITMMDSLLMSQTSNNQFITTQQKQTQANDFMSGLNPAAQSFIKDYISGETTAKNAYSALKPDEKSYVDSLVYNYKATNQTLNTGRTYKDLEPTSQAMVDRITMSMGGTADERSAKKDQITQLINQGITDEKALKMQIYGGELSPTQQTALNTLSDDFYKSKSYTDMSDIKNGLLGVKSGLSQGNGFGDIAAINGFQKMIDPGAVVREGDVSLLQSASSMFDKYDYDYIVNTWVNGDKLPPEVRNRMMKTAKDLYEQKSNLFNTSYGSSIQRRAQASNIPDGFIDYQFPSSKSLLQSAEWGSATGGIYSKAQSLDQSIANIKI